MGRFFVAFRATVAFMGRWGGRLWHVQCFCYLWSVWVGLLWRL